MPTKYFKGICPESLLEGRTETLTNFGWPFGRNDELTNLFWIYLTFNPDDEDLDKTIEEELVFDVVGTEAIATVMEEPSKSSTVPQGMIKKNLMKNISI